MKEQLEKNTELYNKSKERLQFLEQMSTTDKKKLKELRDRLADKQKEAEVYQREKEIADKKVKGIEAEFENNVKKVQNYKKSIDGLTYEVDELKKVNLELLDKITDNEMRIKIQGEQLVQLGKKNEELEGRLKKKEDERQHFFNENGRKERRIEMLNRMNKKMARKCKSAVKAIAGVSKIKENYVYLKGENENLEKLVHRYMKNENKTKKEHKRNSIEETRK